MSHIIVERTFTPPLTDQEMNALMERMAPCLEIYNVRWLRSWISQDRQRGICEYEAADAESVRNVQREAKATFDQVWTAGVVAEP